MVRRISIEEVERAGVTLTPEEAIAVAQQLIAGPGARSAGVSGDLTRHEIGSSDAGAGNPQFGPPSASNVYLESDGCVSCAACDVTFATSEIACFLQEILPPETSRIPGSLRYALARALLEVDAPPFDSVVEFSETLARYERGNRAARVIAVLDRARAALAPPGDESPTPVVDRRRNTPELFELRRHLRESDARLYDQQLALDSVGAARAPARRTRNVAVAAGFAIGLTLVGAGELMRGGLATGSAVPDEGMPTRSTAAAGVVADRTDSVPTTAAPVTRNPGLDASGPHPAASRGANVVEAPKKSTASRVVRPARAARSSNGVLDRLHLGWLRARIVVRNDL
jgi:hypothetical protein